MATTQPLFDNWEGFAGGWSEVNVRGYCCEVELFVVVALKIGLQYSFARELLSPPYGLASGWEESTTTTIV